MLIQWDDEGNFGFSFTLAFNENYTDIFCSVTLQENVRTVITKLFTMYLEIHLSPNRGTHLGVHAKVVLEGCVS